ncbi:unnamed protein product [Tuber aestivum]|uniref:gamma-glutamylcyclotransferase n=1 Tax=Tuber aestivum TaxID=59557 RepID=A0A292Q2W7_9PEZI|nr:unnamed protein product [Tuber aestivum]
MTEKAPLLTHTTSPTTTSPKTINYLAYGSNLNSKTLTDTRHIHPLNATPVRVPSLTLTFTLPGLPYIEPCFANVRPRLPLPPPPAKQERELLGVVYSLRREDYANLITSEGAGAGYQEVTVTCYPLNTPSPTGSKEITARTLLCPEDSSSGELTRAGGQPSGRYLGLIRAGARERGLPDSYVEYLDGLREYRITRVGQSVGKIVVLAVWGPVVALILLLNWVFGREGGGGRAPEWVLAFGRRVMGGVWGCYDAVFVKVFGDGECTEGEAPDFVAGEKSGGVDVEISEVGGEM